MYAMIYQQRETFNGILTRETYSENLVNVFFILTWLRRMPDHEGASPKARHHHCTSVTLNLASKPNVLTLGA